MYIVHGEKVQNGKIFKKIIILRILYTAAQCFVSVWPQYRSITEPNMKALS